LLYGYVVIRELVRHLVATTRDTHTYDGYSRLFSEADLTGHNIRVVRTAIGEDEYNSMPL
jgi:hypothetical protein